MSELGETFKAFKEMRREKKQNNVERSLKLLESRGIAYEVCNFANFHTLVEGRFDFWPSTGKWRERGSGKQARGVKSLIFNVLKEKEAP